jgi:uncharacterized membrane protein
MSHNKTHLFSFIFHKIWTLFLSGLFALLPLTLTIAIFTLTFRLISGWLEPLKQLNLPFLGTTPYSEFILAILIIFAAGMLYNIFILGPIVDAIENILFKLPLVSTVYSGIKKLVEAFSSQDKASFSKVVMVEFPRTGIYSIGFLANEIEHPSSADTNYKYFSIFIPTTPNPTSGFLIIVPENEIILLNISRQDAMAMIISGGIIQPDSIKKDH